MACRLKRGSATIADLHSAEEKLKADC